jgi:large subunit ribosomal protein L29
MTRPSALRELNDEELAHHLVEAKEETFHLRFQLALGKQDNSARLVQVRREVARVLTLIEERRADAALALVHQRGAVQRARRAAAPAGKAPAAKRKAAAPASKRAAPARKASAPARKAKVSADG